MDIVILAGGIGSRYGGEKQIDALGPNGAWLMDYSLYDAHQAGFTRAIIIARAERVETITEHAQARWGSVLDIVTIPQPLLGREKPWGTGHATLLAQTAATNPFMLINADDFYGKAAYTLLYQFLQQATPSQWAMVGYPLASTLSAHGPVSRGVCATTPDLQLTHITEQSGLTADSPLLNENETENETESQNQGQNQNPLVSMNAWGCSPLLFDVLTAGWEQFYPLHRHDATAEYFLPSAIADAIHQAQAKVQVLTPTANTLANPTNQWMGMTYAADKAAVQQALQALHELDAYPPQLQAGSQQ